MSGIPGLTVRQAELEDRDQVVDFNLRLAIETEDKQLDPKVLAAGVEQAIREPERLRYWVAVSGDQAVGQAAITREWSDWRNGWLWWLQSVYVVPEARGCGVFRALFGRIRDEAQAASEVVGLRLYVEAENWKARQTYESLGLKPGGYLVFEDIWGGGITRHSD